MYGGERPDPIELIVRRDGEEIALKINWDADLEKYYENFLVILRWLTFINPEQMLLLAGTEEFEEYIQALALADEKLLDNIIEQENSL